MDGIHLQRFISEVVDDTTQALPDEALDEVI
jgi:hypothetical protein